MSWDGCYNDGAMDLKKGNQFNYLLRVIPAVAYTLANILAIHPASYLTFDRAFYLNIHVILFEIYIYIYTLKKYVYCIILNYTDVVSGLLIRHSIRQFI